VKRRLRGDELETERGGVADVLDEQQPRMKSAGRSLALVAAMSMAAACGGETPGPTATPSTSPSTPSASKSVGMQLIAHRNPLGFTISHPAGWRVDANDDALIAVRSADESETVVVQPFFLRKPHDASHWLRQLPGAMPVVFGGASIDRIRPVRSNADEAAALMTLSRGGREYRASALCSIFGKSGMLFAIVAPADRFDARKNELVAILKSFSFVEPSSASAAAKPAIAFDRWTDPNEQAFSVEVPRGWKTAGGSARFASVDVRSGVRTESPDGNAWVFSGDTDIPPFTPPSQMLAMAGFREGMWYSPGYGVNMMVRSYETGRGFAQSYAESVLGRRCSGVTITSARDRADASEAINAIYAQFGQGVNMRLSTGEVAFTCGSQASPRQGYVFGGTLATQAGMGAIWNVQYLAGFIATPNEAPTAESTLKHMLDSLQLNPDWVARQQSVTMATSQIVTRTNAAIADIIKDTYEHRQAVMDDVFRKWSNTTLGLTDLRDPDTGDTYKVAAGHNYYWRKGETIAGTSTYERPDIGFTPLIEW